VRRAVLLARGKASGPVGADQRVKHRTSAF
jgi:hypothetical protein